MNTKVDWKKQIWMWKPRSGSPGHMWKNVYYRNVKWTFEDLLPWYFYAIKTTVEQSDRKLRNLLLQAKERTATFWCHCITSEQWTWLLCSVSLIPANKLSLQQLKLFNRNLATNFRFSRNFWFLVPISRGGVNARFALPLQTLMQAWFSKSSDRTYCCNSGELRSTATLSRKSGFTNWHERG